ncbi:MAG: alkaline phosphatase [Bacteroidetes bacterium]|nr:MAG: alkaline phosphatase [Bacteroidota bacterium]
MLLLLLCWQCQRPLPKMSTTSPQAGKEATPPPAVILLIGDGMGLTQMSAALYSSKTPLALESFPHIGFHKAYSASELITDSAAGATAFACGQKTYNGAIGMTADTLPCSTILEEAEARQLATGLVATSTIVHATPASFVAHQQLRVFYEEIALDMVNSGVDLLIGGGKRYFDRRKADDRDLLAELQSKGYKVRDYFDGDLSDIKPDTALGFAYFSADNQPLPVNQGRNYLTYATQLSTWFLNLKGQQNGFFLMVEGSQIDWANHANEGRLAIQEVLDFDRAVATALAFARKRGNTLVLVTADHESGGMAIQPGSKIGKVKLAFTTNGHTGSLVPVYAYGPGGERFRGIYENTQIYHKIRQFYGWDTRPQTVQMDN